MHQSNDLSRRTALKAMSAGGLAAVLTSRVKADSPPGEPQKPNGNIKQSICRWCYGKIPLDKLAEEAVPTDLPTGPVDPSLFIAETGRSTITSLIELAAADVLAKVNAGDVLTIDVQEKTVSLANSAGEAVGKLEPKLRQRLIRLMGMGNEYSAIVTSVDDAAVRVIIRETHRDPSMGNRPSFPTTGDAFRGYVRDSLLRYDLDEEEEDEDLEGGEPEAEHEPDAAGDTDEIAIDEVHEDAHDDDEDDN